MATDTIIRVTTIHDIDAIDKLKFLNTFLKPSLIFLINILIKVKEEYHINDDSLTSILNKIIMENIPNYFLNNNNNKFSFDYILFTLIKINLNFFTNI